MKIVISKNFLKISTLLALLASPSTAFLVDTALPAVSGIKSMVDRDSVGFEWKSLAATNVKGVNIYRALAKKGNQQTFEKIDSVSNRFATHYVDTTIKPGRVYFYTFTTFAGLSESAHSRIIRVQSKRAYKPVKFVEAKLVDRGIVKLLWVPHPAQTIVEYVIQRNCNGSWHYLKSVKGRLYPEYVDTTAPRGRECSYRVFARDALGINSSLGKELSVKVK